VRMASFLCCGGTGVRSRLPWLGFASRWTCGCRRCSVGVEECCEGASSSLVMWETGCVGKVEIWGSCPYCSSGGGLLRLLTIVTVVVHAVPVVEMGSNRIQIPMFQIASIGCCRFVLGGDDGSGRARRMCCCRGDFFCLVRLL
jgi:hypothetical protein